MTAATKTTLKEFVGWCGEHISGDEKGEAQLFLDQLFRACGHAGLKEAGATCEDRIKKDGGGTATAPGVSPSYPDPARLVTPDCLGAAG